MSKLIQIKAHGCSEPKKMKKKSLLIPVIVYFLFVILLPTIAQVIDFNNQQNFAISGPTTLPFSSTSNNTFKNNFPTNPVITLDFQGFLGSTIRIIGQADLITVTPSIEVNKGGIQLLDFSMANANSNSFGLSVTPLFGAAVFSLIASSSPNPPPSTSSSSSGGISTTSSSSSSSSSGGGPTPGTEDITLSGPQELVLQPKGANLVKYLVSAFEFSSKSQCQVFTSNDNLVKVKPRIFLLSPKKDQKVVEIFVPLRFAVDLINTSTVRNLLVNVTCENGASDQLNLFITH